MVMLWIVLFVVSQKVIRVAVRSRFPANLLEAESLALAIEAAAQEEGNYTIPSQAVRSQVQPAINYDPMELDSFA